MPYLGKTPSQATRQRYYKTASGGETSLSGTMTVGGTLTFSDGEFVDVSVNGVALVAGTDYNTNTANTIAGLSALTAGDQVEIVVYDTFSVFSGDVSSNMSVGGNLSVTGTTTLTGNADFNGNLDVDGTTNLDAVDIDGAVDMASTLTLAGNADFNGNLDVDGTTDLDGLTVAGNLSVDGGTIKLDGNYPTGTTNTALGDTALDSVQSGGGLNVAIGQSSLTGVTTGDNNTGVGAYSGITVSTSSDNSYFGAFSGYHQTGATNTALGYAAMNGASGQSSGSGNTAAGYNSLTQNTSGSNNVAVGKGALQTATTANNSTCIGQNAGLDVTTAALTAVGQGAGANVTSGSGNTCIGQNAGQSVTTTTENVFIGGRSDGVGAGYSTTGGSNTFIGSGAGSSVTSGTKNTILGRYDGNQGGLDIRTASNHIVLSDGDGNPRVVVDSSGNVGIGTTSPAATIHSHSSTAGGGHIRSTSANLNNFIDIGTDTGGAGVINAGTAGGTMNFQTAGTERMRLSSAGDFQVSQNGTVNTSGTVSGVNISAQYGTFQANFHGNDYPVINIHSSGANNRYFDFRFGNSGVGSISTNGSTTSYNTSSDYRLKEAVVDMTGAIDRVKALAPKRFNFIVDPDTTVDGFLAHEAQTVVPEAITGTKDAMMDEKYIVNAATGDIYTPAAPATYDEDGEELTAATDEVIHSSDAEKPEELADGQQWRETTAAVMGTRSVPDYQGIDQSKLVPLLTGALQEAVAKIEALETRVAALEA